MAGSAGFTWPRTATSPTAGWCSRACSTPATPTQWLAALAERQFLAQVEHPNIVRIYNFVQQPDRVTGEASGYIVMEYVGGKSLKQILQEARAAGGSVPLPIALAYAIEVLPALGYLHDRGLVYCDFKPDNVIQTEEQLKLIDMGGVRPVDGDGAIYGTTGYQAPEIADEGPSPESDLYTVGRALAVMTFDFKGYQGDYKYRLPDGVPLLEQHESYRRLLLRATNPDPGRRFGSASEMVDQLTGVLREVLAVDDGRPRPSYSRVFSPELRAVGTDGAVTVPPASEVIAALPVPQVDGSDPAAGYLATLAGMDPAQREAALSAAVAGQAGVPVPVAESAETQLALARARIDLGDLEGAATVLQKLAAADPADWRIAWCSGLREVAAGRAAVAAGAFSAVYDELPGEIAPKLALALAAEAAGDLARADHYYRLVWTGRPLLRQCRVRAGPDAPGGRRPARRHRYAAEHAQHVELLRGGPDCRGADARRRADCSGWLCSGWLCSRWLCARRRRPTRRRRAGRGDRVRPARGRRHRQPAEGSRRGLPAATHGGDLAGGAGPDRRERPRCPRRPRWRPGPGASARPSWRATTTGLGDDRAVAALWAGKRLPVAGQAHLRLEEPDRPRGHGQPRPPEDLDVTAIDGRSTEDVPCPNCRQLVGVWDGYCEACGTELAPPVVSSGTPGHMAQCPVCTADPDAPAGGVSEDGYCEVCGRKVPSDRDHVEVDLGLLAGISDRGLRHSRNEDAMALATSRTPDGQVAIAVVCDGVSTSPRPDDASLAAAQAAVRELLTAARLGDDLEEASLAAVRLASGALRDLAGPDGCPRARTRRPWSARGASPCAGLATAGPTGWPPVTRQATALSSRTRPPGRSPRRGCVGAPGRDPVRPADEGRLAGRRARRHRTAIGGDAMASPQAHVITQWLGADAPDPLNPHVARFEPPDRGSCCSARTGCGITGPRRPHLAAMALPEALTSPLDAAAVLVKFANDAGGRDNITAVLVPFPLGTPRRPSNRRGDESDDPARIHRRFDQNQYLPEGGRDVSAIVDRDLGRNAGRRIRGTRRGQRGDHHRRLLRVDGRPADEDRHRPAWPPRRRSTSSGTACGSR